MSMLQMRVSASPAPEALAAALGQQHAEDSGVAGPSTDDTPQIVRIVHVLDDDVPYTRTRAAAGEWHWWVDCGIAVCGGWCVTQW